MLANRLKELAENNTLRSLMTAYRSVPSPNFQNLLRRCEHKPPVLYATDTIEEFHHLLVGILVAYASSLQHLFSLANKRKHLADQQHAEEQRRAHEQQRTAKHRHAGEQRRAAKQKRAGVQKDGDERRLEERKLAEEQRLEEERKFEEEQRLEEKRKREEQQESLFEEMREDASIVSFVGRLLSCLLNSNALRLHLGVLSAKISLPNLAYQHLYEEFAKENGFQPVQVTRWGKNKGRKRDKNWVQGTDLGKGNDSREGHDSGEGNDLGEGNDSREGHDAGEGNESDISDEEELDQYRSDLANRGVASTVLGWLKTFTCHYSAKGILEHHCVKHLAKLGPGSDVEVSIVGVSGKKRTVSDWSTMQQSIKFAISAHDPNRPPSYLDQVIQTLETKIRYNARMKVHPMKKMQPPRAIYVTFGKLLEGREVERYFAIHCEAAIVSFSKHSLDATFRLPAGTARGHLCRLAEVTFTPPAFVDCR